MKKTSRNNKQERLNRRNARVNAILEHKGTVAPKYDTENTAEVLFRMNASVWSAVLPWCLCNTAFAAVIFFSDKKFDIISTDRGHAFMSLSVSYLLVTRTKICLDRYMKQRALLGDLTRTCKELVNHAILYTRFKNRGEEGTMWRCSVAKRTICLLKVIVSVLQYPTTKRNVWEIHDLPKEVRQALLLAVGKSNERTPMVLTLFLRTVIASHSRKLSHQLEIPQELELMQYTTHILDAYTEIMSYMSTPYPFPLIQMTRTILIFYIFSLPLALANDFTSPVPYLVIIFFITYGFMGMELVCVEIDDPFGIDPNDFDVDAITKTVYKDIIVFISDSDGPEAELEVKNSIVNAIDDECKTTARENNWGKQPLDTKKQAIPQDSSTDKIEEWHRKKHTLSDTSAIFKELHNKAVSKRDINEAQSDPVQQTQVRVVPINNQDQTQTRKIEKVVSFSDSVQERKVPKNHQDHTHKNENNVGLDADYFSDAQAYSKEDKEVSDNLFRTFARGESIASTGSLRHINTVNDELSLDEEEPSPVRAPVRYGDSHSLIISALHKKDPMLLKRSLTDSVVKKIATEEEISSFMEFTDSSNVEEISSSMELTDSGISYAGISYDLSMSSEENERVIHI